MEGRAGIGATMGASCPGGTRVLSPRHLHTPHSASLSGCLSLPMLVSEWLSERLDPVHVESPQVGLVMWGRSHPTGNIIGHAELDKYQEPRATAAG